MQEFLANQAAEWLTISEYTWDGEERLWGTGLLGSRGFRNKRQAGAWGRESPSLPLQSVVSICSTVLELVNNKPQCSAPARLIAAQHVWVLHGEHLDTALSSAWRLKSSQEETLLVCWLSSAWPLLNLCSGVRNADCFNKKTEGFHVYCDSGAPILTLMSAEASGKTHPSFSHRCHAVWSWQLRITWEVTELEKSLAFAP